MRGLTLPAPRAAAPGDPARPPGGTLARRQEGLLLTLVVVIVLYGYIAAGMATGGAVPDGAPGFALTMCCLAFTPHLAVRRFAPYADPLILPLATLLTGLGLVLLHRLDHAYRTPPAGGQQLLWTVLGVAACLLTLALLKDYRQLQRNIYVTMAAALVLLIAPALYPGDTYGAKRWVYLGPVSFQPGEFVKVMIAVFFAGYLVSHRDALALTGRRALGIRLPPGRQLGPIVAVWSASLLVLVLERDLGTSLIFFGLFIVMLYVATGRGSWVVCGPSGLRRRGRRDRPHAAHGQGAALPRPGRIVRAAPAAP
ncbi:FtsW/RodA/SpoVE family cell cycle protein [Streptomyces sioyaensis]|uniref:FtsW/RodA/SpoVE family cell cycle protein n=1 Tax=Streptomyces sioyaensis TaxID=67364 RepID=UPI00378E3F43